MDNKYRLSDGLVRQNIVLMSGVAIGPVAAFAVNYDNAAALSVGFTVIALLSVFVCRFIPKKLVYTIRVIIYALISGLSVIPAYMVVRYYFGQDMLDNIGVYLPVLALNPLILTKTETRFSLRAPHLMLLELCGYIAGFNIVCLAVGIIRDLLANGKIGSAEFNTAFTVPASSTVFGGLILVGIAAGIFRWQYNKSKERLAKRIQKEKEQLELLKMVE